jgi:cytoskeletal protein RodZ
MKKLLLFLFMMMISVLILSACGSNDEDPETEETDPAAETETEDTTETDEEPAEEETADTDDPAAEDTETEDQAATEKSGGGETGDTGSEEEQAAEENEAFRVYEPAPNETVETAFTVRGEASVTGGTVYYEFEDGHNILDEGSVSAGETPDWGEFEFTVTFDEVAFNNGTLILYEETEDGSRENQLIIPVTVD